MSQFSTLNRKEKLHGFWKQLFSYSFLRMIGMGLSFIYVIVLAKTMSPDSLGVYYLTMTIISFLMVISRLGFDNLVVKTIAVLSRNNDLIAIKKFHQYVSKKILHLSIILIIGTVIFSKSISNTFLDGAENNYGLLIVSCVLYFYNMIFIYSESLKANGNLNLSVCLPNILFPLLNIVNVSLLFPIYGNVGIFLSVSISVIIVYIASLIIIKKRLRGFHGTPEETNQTYVLKVPYDFYFISLSNFIFAFIDTLTLGLFSSNSDVGIYNVILRLVLPFSVLLIIINNVFSRKFTVWYAENRIDKCISVYKSLVGYSFIFAIIYLSIIILFGNEMLLFFGHEYLIGKSALIIIALGYFILLVTGPSAAILMMCGHEKKYKNIVLWTGGLGVILSCILTYYFGLIGAAFSTSVSLIIKNLVSFYLASTCLGVKFRG